MDSLLLCTEQWLNNIPTDDDQQDKHEPFTGQNITIEDSEETFKTFLNKEVSYMPEPDYFNHVTSDSLLNNSRFRAICWIIRSQQRLNLSPETVFCAVNYFDRFISTKLCQSWKHWVFELLAIACLSVASKYNEAIPPSFRDILKMEENLDKYNYFESSVIQRMELTLVKALQWRLGPITSYSYVEILSMNSTAIDKFTDSVTQLLLDALLDDKFVEFRPCVIAISAVEYMNSKELLLSSTATNKAFLINFNALIRKYIKEDDLIKCYKMMEEYDLGGGGSIICSSSFPPSSPVTVLGIQQYHSDLQVRFFLLKRRNTTIEYDSASGERRKKARDHEHDDGECGIIGDHDHHPHPSGAEKERISGR